MDVDFVDRGCAAEGSDFQKAHKPYYQGLQNPCHKEESAKLYQSMSQHSKSEMREFGNLFSHLLEKSWPKSQYGREATQGQILQHLLTWTPFTGFLKMTESKKGQGRILSESAGGFVAVGKSILDATIQQLFDGSIQVCDLILVLANRAQFIELHKAAYGEPSKETEKSKTKEKETSCQNVIKMLDRRKKETDAFEEERTAVSSFIGICTTIQPVETKDLQDKVETDVKALQLNMLCNPITLDNDHTTPDINFFHLSKQVKDVLQPVRSVHTSLLFQDLWFARARGFRRDKVKDGGNDRLTVDEVATHVWKSVQTGIIQIVTKTQNGSITLKEVDNLYGRFFDHYEQLEKELQLLCGSQPKSPWIKQRIQQIEQHHTLEQRLDAVDVVMEVKEAFKLSGNFDAVDVLSSVRNENFKDKKLDSINEEVVRTSKVLAAMSLERIKCLQDLVHCKTLVDWLKTEIKDVQQLKVFVDLAMISAGETDMEVDRVKYLHQATTGYSSLIFDMQPDAGFSELMEACESLWNALRNDKTLPKKLRDINKHFEWLKGIKESHGSVETSSLSQAEAINSNGIYTVGNITKESKDTIESVITLMVQSDENQSRSFNEDDDEEDDNTDGDKEYSLDMLKDLQSKLMLVAGKAEQGREEVERFTETLSGVTRLATAYLKLCAAGNVLFSKWKAIIYCEQGKKVSVLVDFGIGQNTLQGTDPVYIQLQKLCNFMEDVLQEWLDYVEEKRSDIYHLNYFTTEQLVILRSELAQLLSNEDNVSPGVYTLLAVLKSNCTEDDVKEALNAAFLGVGRRQLPTNDMMAQIRPETAEAVQPITNELEILSLQNDVPSAKQPEGGDVETEESDIRRVELFIETMVKDGFGEELAKASLKYHGGSIDVDDAAAWCYQNMHDEEMITQLCQEWEDEIEMLMLAKENTSVQSVVPAAVAVGGAAEHVVDKDIHAAGTDLKTAQSMYSSDVSQATMSSLSSITTSLLRGLRTSKGDLIKKLQELWKDYQDSLKETSVEDYLSLEHLGHTLQYLAAKEPMLLDRQFPSYLTPGKPNMMVRPHGEILRTVLSIYMYGSGGPLPSYDEVLLCTPQTTLEEVVLLWRRAMYDGSGKIYCLVNADQLDYEVSTKAEEKRNKLAVHIKEDYHLVVLCSREREDHSHMVTALDSYRIDPPNLPLIKDIQSYLQQQFINQAAQVRTVQTAASVTHDRCCVLVVTSERAGVGKSLVVRRLSEKLQRMPGNRSGGKAVCITVPLAEKKVDQNVIVSTLTEYITKPTSPVPRIFHFDITPAVHRGVDDFLFNLIILGGICNLHGHVWRRNPWDLYVIEITSTSCIDKSVDAAEAKVNKRGSHGNQPFFAVLPTITCRSPRDTYSLEVIKSGAEGEVSHEHDPLMDDQEFRSSAFQRVYQYLVRKGKGVNLDFFDFEEDKMEGDHVQCLEVLLRFCGIEDPSWAELRHFVWFLHEQLQDCEHSVFCNSSLLEDASLNGFLNFVVKFMIQMSKDFATPSLLMSDESTSHLMQERGTEDEDDDDDKDGTDDIAAYQLRRRWENSPHPYIFFNHDRVSMTFMGFYIDGSGNLVDPVSGQTLERCVMTRPLKRGLELQRVNLQENFDSLPRAGKIGQLCQVMGIDWPFDPDETYELTTDNVKKILAIHMRFRCGIPVIIMGETGCGKTRLIRFMCQLQAGIESVDGPKNMILMKVHGGTTAMDVARKVKEAEKLAVLNKQKHKVDTILFFDEANTTEAIGLIKEIMCDRRMNGKPLSNGVNALKIIAACNPYRRHTDDMIDRLEKAGLGYHIKAEETDDKLGRIPLRQLVYRVQALPPSMLPLVWDFGQLSSEVEELYIKQIVARYVNSQKIPAGREEVISTVLAASQRFMRQRKNECSFVSLRDVERTMNVLVWFYEHKMIDQLMREKAKTDYDDETDDEDDEDEEDEYEPMDPLTLALVLSLGVCYHACLQEERENYRDEIADHFSHPCIVPGGSEQILEEITRCQDLFLDQLQLGPNIARNAALKENVFMMVVCIELRIPLFLVGKPGSSKSLAKTIVADAMQGETAASPLFKTFKQVHMVSYQCSPLSTPEGIVGTFRQCSRFQEDKDLNCFVSVVVLDEVGLAEDSPKLPLKTLHPLLEYGCDDNDNPPAHKKVAFIGISNWALDPAKMNRGILVSRGVPDEDELVESARGICSTSKFVQGHIGPMISALSKGYLEVYTKQTKEFFGLRDFYSLVKMVYGFSKASKKPPSWLQLEHAIRRNFGGLDDRIDPVSEFDKLLHNVDKNQPRGPNDPECGAAALIRASLQGLDREILDMDSDSRYLLVLTENYAALGILQQQLLSMEDTVIIFGSSFPKDQEYTQVCRNINRIKVCMETGRTVVLLNLENLYESLYDALNQYYVYFGGQRYVDLGLGTHRVKCRVHNEFRLIVVADKEVVYERFPIPLINRLEKHFLAMTTMLTHDELQIVHDLDDWVQHFATIKLSPFERQNQRSTAKFKVEDAFIGFNNDTIASIVLQVCSDMTQHEANDDQDWAGYVYGTSQDLLLQCATPDSVARLVQTGLSGEAERLWHRYNAEQKHDSVAEYLDYQIKLAKQKEKMTGILAQVTTHSRLLSRYDIYDVADHLGLAGKVLLKNNVFLQAFQTEQQFTRTVRDFFTDSNLSLMERLLLVQCDSGDENTNLIACSRYIVQDERAQAIKQNKGLWQPAHVVFIIQLPRIAGGCFDGLQGGKWLSVHIDELRPPHANLPKITALQNKPISLVFESDITKAKQPTQKEENEQVLQDQAEMLNDHGEIAAANTMGIREGLSLEDIQLTQDFERGMDLDNTEITEGKQMVAVESTDLVESKRSREPVGGKSGVTGDEGHEMDTTEAMDIQQVENTNEADIEEAITSTKTILLNTSALLRNCIHAAAAMLEDDEDRSERSTQRIEILLELFKQNDDQQDQITFVSILKERICQLLKEKDERAGHLASQWLSREAVTGEKVQVHGTFRRAIWQSLVGTVTPLLAEVIAFSDRNDNLDLIKMAKPNSWVHRLWLEILRNPNLSELSYEMFLSQVKKAQKDIIPVPSSGANNSHFAGQCPFSWVIRNFANEMWESALSMKASARQSVKQNFETLLSESELGKTVLGNMVNEEDYDDFIQCYLEDFVRMMYKASNETEYKPVTAAIVVAAKEEHVAEDYDPNDFFLDIPSIHHAYHRIHGRLDSYSQVVKLLPHPMDIPIEQSMQLVFDAMALRALLESLEPQKDYLNDINNRKGWLKRVKDARPVVERILDAEKQAVGMEIYGEISRTHIRECRPLWVRICVLKLFVDHVCAMDTKKVGEENIKKCYQLSKTLGEKVDLKSERSMTFIENFLKKCNETASKQHFKYGVHECDVCQEAIKEPVVLPCEHVFCLQCVKTWFRIQKRTCPKCNAVVADDFRVQTTEKSKEAVAQHNAFRQRCNAFFMELVSRYCFAEGAPPEPELITKLMSYVTKHSEKKQLRTKGFTPFQEDCIDPNPVVRSFLLQLLLRSSVEQVYEHLQIYLDEAREFMQTDAEILELCLLCIQCIEDSFHNRALHYGSDSQLGLIREAMEKLDPSVHTDRQTQGGINVYQLESIAGARFGLVIAAELIYRYYGDNEQQNKAQQERQPENFNHARRLLDIARKFCDNSTSKWPKVFLIKQLGRRYGTDCIQSLIKQPQLRWIMPPEGNVQVAFVPDRFVVCGSTYQELREAMAETLLSADFKKVDYILRVSRKSEEEKQSLLLLAIYREITMCHANKYADGAQQSQVDGHVIQKLITYTKQTYFVKLENFAQELILNSQGGKCAALTVSPDQSPFCRTVAAIVVHAMIVLQCCSQHHAVEPFITLMKNPQHMSNSYFPTMHEDLIMEARAAISKETVNWYECPNGHPYMIGDCGRPYGLGQCRDCGATIGGEQHTPAQGNRLARTGDTTQTGHVLGPPGLRHGEIPIPERLMPPAAVAIVRLLMHAAMLGAATKTPKNLVGVFQPAMNANAVPAFLWNHLECDLRLLSRATGKSVDDAAVMIHMILDGMLTVKPKGHQQFNPLLSSKKCRQNWEDTFTKTYINPVIEGISQSLPQANRHIHNDKRLGNNPLLKLLYEVDPPSEQLRLESMYNIPTVWRYRSRVTIEHLTHALQENMASKKSKRKYRILQQFLDREHTLRAIKYLPDVVQLQQLLIDKYHRNIDIHEATNLKIGRFLRELPQGHIRDKYCRLMDSFAKAWNLVKSDIATYGGLHVPKELSERDIDENSSLSMILPTRKSDGVCSTALLDFLIVTQNEFIQTYNSIAKHSESERNEEIPPSDLTPADLIAYHPEKDLLPMVLSNCSYSLEVGQGTLVEYNLSGLEKQLEERFIRGKAKIKRKIEQLVFRQDSRDAVVFETLKSKIPQEPLSKAIQHQILSELRSLTDVCDSLACLDIAIGFLATSGGKPDMLVTKYLTTILKMDKDEMKVKYSCHLRQVLALWQLLAVERARRLTLHSQDPFDSLHQDFREPLEQEHVESLNTVLKYIDVDYLVNELHQYIAIELKKPRDAETNIASWNLKDGALVPYIEFNDGKEIAGFNHFPDDILVKHIWWTWTLIINYQHKEAERY
ncbi:E3 ubiquitin-protein ligase rnf213-alpha-like [Glandiceps talaboti]